MDSGQSHKAAVAHANVPKDANTTRGTRWWQVFQTPIGVTGILGARGVYGDKNSL